MCQKSHLGILSWETHMYVCSYTCMHMSTNSETEKLLIGMFPAEKSPIFFSRLGCLYTCLTLYAFINLKNKNSNQKLAHNLKSHVIVIPLLYFEFHTAWCILYTFLCFVKVSLWCSVLHPCHKYSELYSMKKCWKQDHIHATVTLFFSVQTCIWILLYINYVFGTLITFQQPILCMSF